MYQKKKYIYTIQYIYSNFANFETDYKITEV